MTHRRGSDPIVADNTEEEDNLEDMDLARLTELVGQMAQIQIANGQPAPQQPREEGLLEVIKRASTGISEFKKNNLTNFLACVQMHYDATAIAHRAQILRIAQQKVTGSTQIETSAYVTFDQFKTDMLAHFKPAKSHVQLEVELATLTRKKDESIDQLAKRALVIKVDYELAYRSELQALGADLDAIRLIEVERKSINSFRNAIPQEILLLMGPAKTHLNDEINSATAAEANLAVRKRNASFASSDPAPHTSRDKVHGDKNIVLRSESFKKKDSDDKTEPFCYVCKKKNHLAPDCYFKKPSEEVKAPEAPIAHAKSSKKSSSKISSSKASSKNESSAGTSVDGSTVSARTLKARNMHRSTQ